MRRKNNFLNGARECENNAAPAAASVNANTVCVNINLRRAGGRAGAELLFTRVIAPCCCCAGDELYYYVRLLQREMRKFDARRILTQFGFCLAAAKSFHLRSGQPAAAAAGRLLSAMGSFSFLMHSAPAQTNGRVNCLMKLSTFISFSPFSPRACNGSFAN